jgi:TusE/DsrC/DsvC family sulfur relay protein
MGRCDMDEIEFGGKKIKLDETGFLVDGEDWNEQVAQVLAEREGIGQLKDEHMEIVKFIRSYYNLFNAFPILNNVCRNVNQPKDCVNEEFINPEKAWKIAGLPKQPGLNFVTFDGKRYLLEECC